MKKQRMYSIVLRHLSGIQKGIQHGHSKDNFEIHFGKNEEYSQWLKNDKTVVVLQCNSCRELLEVTLLLDEYNVNVAIFYEEDLDNIPTSISFLVDETVWDRETYPDVPFAKRQGQNVAEEQLKRNEKKYGKQTAFLKSYLRQFLLATN